MLVNVAFVEVTDDEALLTTTICFEGRLHLSPSNAIYFDILITVRNFC